MIKFDRNIGVKTEMLLLRHRYALWQPPCSCFGTNVIGMACQFDASNSSEREGVAADLTDDYRRFLRPSFVFGVSLVIDIPSSPFEIDNANKSGKMRSL